MPCNSEYMNPSKKEENSREVAELLVFVREKMGAETTSEIKKAAKNIYGNVAKLDWMTQELCRTLRNIEQNHPELFEAIVYNGRDKTSRQLADWWEEHNKADIARRKQERLQEEKREKEYNEYLRLKEKFGK